MMTKILRFIGTSRWVFTVQVEIYDNEYLFWPHADFQSGFSAVATTFQL